MSFGSLGHQILLCSSGADLCAFLPQDYVLDLFQPLIDRQQWDDSGSVSERVLRSYLLLFSCYRNYAPCVARATRLFKEWKDSDGTMQCVTRQPPIVTVMTH